jgi:ankyrin repeat protein
MKHSCLDVTSNLITINKSQESQNTCNSLEKRCFLLAVPVELQTKIFVYAQNPAMALVSRHFQNLAQSSLLKAKYLIHRYGHKAALSERSMRRKIASYSVIECLLKQHGCDPTADEFWLYKHACQTHQVDVCIWIIETVVAAKLSDMGSLLSMAAAYGAVDIVDILVENYHVDVHQPNGDELALQVATLYNQTHLVKHLCEKYNCNLHVDNESALRSAAFNGFSSLVEYFINKGANVHAFNNASLASAVHQGHSSVVELLLKSGASARIHNNFCARYAVLRRQDIAILKHLILLGDVNPRFDDDWMLLQACKKGFVEILKFLLTDIMANEIDSIVNMKDGILLKKAILYKQLSVIRLLVSLGADVNSHGCISGLCSLLSTQDRSRIIKDIVKLLVDKGFDISRQSNSIQYSIMQILGQI